MRNVFRIWNATWNRLLVPFALAGILIVGGCATTSIIGTETKCMVFRPITYSAQNDTNATIEQIHKHNAAYEALCGKEDDDGT